MHVKSSAPVRITCKQQATGDGVSVRPSQRAGSTVEQKNVESLAARFDLRIQMWIRLAKEARFWCRSTIFLAACCIWSNNWERAAVVWVLHLAPPLPLSLSLSFPFDLKNAVQGAPGKGHINTRLPDDVHRPRGGLWRHPLCLDKAVRAAEGVNKAGPPSLRCLACQPGDSLAWSGVTTSLPGPGLSTVASSPASYLIALASIVGPLRAKPPPPPSPRLLLPVLQWGQLTLLNAITAAKSNKLRTWYILWRTDPCSWISPWAGGTWAWVMSRVPCNAL